MELRRALTPEDRQRAFEVRKTVFVDEQGVPIGIEIDEHDEMAQHVVIMDGDQPVGAGRVRMIGDTAKLERICVLASHRKYGLGRELVAAMEEIARELGAAGAKLHGQMHAEAFYLKMGYHPVSGMFMEEGIPHVRMVKTFPELEG
ncbi:GNAT family N-acetyltransferase [Paenibacillus nasutitermitis]|uniref:Acetyltransferase n=1 Tax=Paenibacillus nasutitermitis TaxID=1652958 RepID=A0A916ZKQ9_9BACL|nr:GNAT family N-acetyltransferase [Paenibacillus nasutitermitis]GGE01862.1 putative acetyltransferase [Paenibacillus nasutitermitis]